MTNTHPTTPLLMRLNNPGGHFQSMHPDHKTLKRHGYTEYPSLLVGAEALLHRMHRVYNWYGAHDLDTFLASERRLVAHAFMIFRRRLYRALADREPQALPLTINLNDASEAIRFADAWTLAMMGPPKADVADWRGWIPREVLHQAMSNLGKWDVP